MFRRQHIRYRGQCQANSVGMFDQNRYVDVAESSGNGVQYAFQFLDIPVSSVFHKFPSIEWN